MNTSLVWAHWNHFRRGLQQPSLCIQYAPMVREFTGEDVGSNLPKTEGRIEFEPKKTLVDTPKLPLSYEVFGEKSDRVFFWTFLGVCVGRLNLRGVLQNDIPIQVPMGSARGCPSGLSPVAGLATCRCANLKSWASLKQTFKYLAKLLGKM